jgi:hypothetical protein
LLPFLRERDLTSNTKIDFKINVLFWHLITEYDDAASNLSIFVRCRPERQQSVFADRDWNRQSASYPMLINSALMSMFTRRYNTYRMAVNRARQLCSGIHKVQEEGKAEKFMATNYTE